MSNIDNNDIEDIRKKVLDYYMSAMSFNQMAIVDVERCSDMTDEEIIKEARKLNII